MHEIGYCSHHSNLKTLQNFARSYERKNTVKKSLQCQTTRGHKSNGKNQSFFNVPLWHPGDRRLFVMALIKHWQSAINASTSTQLKENCEHKVSLCHRIVLSGRVTESKSLLLQAKSTWEVHDASVGLQWVKSTDVSDLFRCLSFTETI